MGNDAAKQRLVEVAPGFYNIRASFVVLHFLDIGTHMSIIKRPSGKFLVIDTVPLDSKLKEEIDLLTDNGANIEAVIATHPFHTLAFPGFYKEYPKVPYYGTPRHVRRIKDIPWAGDVTENLHLWEPDVQIRIPDGPEWVSPVPETINHFMCAWVFHPATKMLHIDDSINYFEASLAPFLMRMLGAANSMRYHLSLKKHVLKERPDVGRRLVAWLEAVGRDWDFDNICFAHNGVLIGGAKEKFDKLLSDEKESILAFSAAAGDDGKSGPAAEAKEDKKEPEATSGEAASGEAKEELPSLATPTNPDNCECG